MDSVGREYWAAKLQQHREIQSRLFAEKLQSLNVQGQLNSSYAPVAVYEVAIEYTGILITNWILIHQDSWLRQHPALPDEIAKQDAAEIETIIDAEEKRIIDEVTDVSKRFSWGDVHLKNGEGRLHRSCEVLLKKCLSHIEVLKQHRVYEIKQQEEKEQRERINRRKDIVQSLFIAVISSVIGVLLADHFNGRQVKIYQGMVNGLTQELADLRKENQALVRWILKTPREIDREIQRIKEDTEKKSAELKEAYRQKRSTFKSDMAKRGISQSSIHDEGLKKLDLEEQEELTRIETELKRRIEDLVEQKNKLLSK